MMHQHNTKNRLACRGMVFPLLAAPFLAPMAMDAEERPNIVLIYTDDLDFDDIGGTIYPLEQFPSITGAYRRGYYNPVEPNKDGWLPYYEEGSMHIPTFENLAQRGARFDRFYITSPMCTASRYSLLTGRYASRARSLVEEVPYATRPDDAPTPEGEPHWIAWNSYCDPSEPSVAREMSQLGYTTAFFGKWHNEEPDNVDPAHLQREFGDQPEKLARELATAQVKGSEFIRELLGFDVAERLCFGNLEKMGGHNLPWYTEGVVDFIKRDHERPFFIYLALPLPHSRAIWPHYGEDMDPLLTPAGRLDKAPDSQPSIQDVRRRLQEKGISTRSACVTWIDDAVAAIQASLDQQGLLENTIIIFTSDHQSRGKSQVYEGTRVPFIVMGPQVKAGTQITDICSNIDILPTLMDLAGAKPRTEGVDGISFADNLRTGETQHPGRALMLESRYGRAIVRGHWKYIANRPPNFFQVQANIRRDRAMAAATGTRPAVDWRGGRRENHSGRGSGGLFADADINFPWITEPDQLYNLAEDPFEQFNRIDDPSCARWLETLRNELRALLKTGNRPFDL